MTRRETDAAQSLRTRAEEMLAAQNGHGLVPNPEDFRQLAHDLAVHQVELEIQNEELKEANLRVDALLSRFSHLYHQAPVGFLTLDENGVILQCNQTFMDMLGRATPDLAGRGFPELLESPGREVFLGRYRALFNEPEGKTLDARLGRQVGPALDIRISGRIEPSPAGHAPPRSARRLLLAVHDIQKEKAAEDALRESEARYRSIADSSPAIIYRFSNRRGGLYYSPHALEQLGYTPEHLLANPRLWYESIHPEDQPRVDAGIASAMSGQADLDLTYRIRHASGVERSFRDRARGRRESTGEVVIDGVAVDITDLLAAQAAVREREANFREFFASISDVVLVCSPEGRILFSNPAATRILGYTPMELAAMHVLDLNPPAQRRAAEEILAQVLRGERDTCPLPLVRKDGSELPAESRAWPGTWNGTRCLFATCKDLTEQEEAQQRFESIFRNNPNPMVLSLQPDRRIFDVNGAFLRLLGYDRDEVLGKSPLELGLAVDPERLEQGHVELEATGRITGVELQVRRKDGTVLEGLFFGDRVQNHGKAFLLITMVDLTERKRAEAERERIQERLFHSQRMESLGTIASGVAHDMNNVLGAILGIASAGLRQVPAESPLRKSLETIVQATDRGGRMVNRLLTLSRQSPAEERVLDLNTVIREAAGLLERTVLAKVQVVLELAEDLWPVRGEESALAHALMNLCVNAVDAMPDGGRLVLRTRNLEDGRVEVQVEDEGLGMEPEVLKRALDPFFTTKPQGKGTGLGLAMTFSAVQSHQGTIELRSAPSRGTTVTLRLPALPPASTAAAPAKVPAASEARGPAPLRVLVVDDDELMQMTTRALLEVLGHAVSVVASGESALEWCAAGGVADVVILDLNMPGLGGAGTLPRLRALLPRLPVILATGRADQSALNLITGHPGVTLLPKPYDLDGLKAVLEATASAAEGES